MASETNEGDELTALLERFADAWNRHDCESLLSMVTEDCEFRTAAGPTAAGSIFVGKAQLREAFPLAWMTYPDASWNEARHFVFGCRGSASGRSAAATHEARQSKSTVSTCWSSGTD